MKRSILTALTVASLAGCEAVPGDDLVMNTQGLERAAEAGPDAIAPSVSRQVAINAFAKYCGQYAGNPRKTEQAAKADDYVLLLSGSSQNLKMYISNDGGPMVSTGTEDGVDVCMVLFKKGGDLGSTLESYVSKRHQGQATNVGELSLPQGEAKNVWITQDVPPLMYFTFVQKDPQLGLVEAIANVTE